MPEDKKSGSVSSEQTNTTESTNPTNTKSQQPETQQQTKLGNVKVVAAAKQAAQARPKKRESIVVCTYGPSGVGKTTDQGFSFPRALFVAAPGALTSISTVCGYSPATTFVKTIEDATKLIRDVSRDFDAVVIDDFSFLAEQTLSVLEKKYKGFALWGELRDTALEFRDTARFAGVDVIINCWETPPKALPSGKIRGGPMLSGKLPEQIPALCDIVLRASHDPNRKPWPAVYRCSNDPSYIMKDRFNVATVIDPAPMNLAELLRAARIDIDRHPSFEQQEEMVEMIAQNIVAHHPGEQVKIINEYFIKLKEAGVSIPFARWTLRDALDRATIRNALDKANNSFIDMNSL